MRVGCIYHHRDFCAEAGSGELRGKYLLILSLPPGGDVVYRLPTSRDAHARPQGCHHGFPYPGYSLGILSGELERPTWVDLREQDDYDNDVFAGKLRRGVIREVLQLQPSMFREVLACASGADDTTARQSRCIRDALAEIGA